MPEPESREPIPLGDAIEVEDVGVPRARRPRLPGSVVYRDDPDDVIDAMLSEVLIHGLQCVQAFGDFQFVVSGEPGMEFILRRMMFDPALRSFPWAKTRLWVLGDRVPAAGDWPYSTAVEELLVHHSGLPHDQFAGYRGEDPWSAAHGYTSRLREVLGWRPKGHDRLDCVLARLTASGEFGAVHEPAPGADHAGDTAPSDVLAAVNKRASEMVEVGLTTQFLNASRMVVLFATGREVAPVLSKLDIKRLSPGAAPDPAIPVSGLNPLAGELRWYVDAAACRSG